MKKIACWLGIFIYALLAILAYLWLCAIIYLAFYMAHGWSAGGIK